MFKSNWTLRRRSWAIILLPLMFMVVVHASRGQDQSPASPEGLLDESALTFGDDALSQTGAEELMLFAEVPMITSASRARQPINLSSVPVSIVSSDDIHYSGLTTLADLMMFVPGMDVLFTDRNNAAVGVRGLHHTFSDRTLVLIDGRNAGTTLLGGAHLFQLPILPEDIARIEVVRGPGGAAWGANAFNGVINIIMKKPQDVPGFFASTTLNQYGDTFSHLRLAQRIDQWSYRLSVGYEDFESSDDAVDHDHFFSNDHARNTRIDSEVIYEPSGKTKVSFGAAMANLHTGDFEFAGFPVQNLQRSGFTFGPDPRGQDRIQAIRLHARVDHEFDDGSSGYLQWFSHFDNANRYSMGRWDTSENDWELQYNFKPTDDHEVSAGGNFRYQTIETRQVRSTDVFASDREDEYWLGVFGIDRWRMADRFTLETQFRADWYSQTDLDWSGRVTGLLALDDPQRHVLRFSAAKAFRAPAFGIRQVRFSHLALPSPPAPPGLFAYNLQANPDLKNEQIWSLEAGYQGMLTERWSLGINGYYQWYEDLIGAAVVPDPLGLGRSVSTLENIAGAQAVGVEVQVKWHQENLELTAWYSFQQIAEDQAVQSLRAFRPARHKAGVTGRVFLPDDWAVNVNYKFSSLTENEPVGFVRGNVDSFHRLDLTLSKKFAKGAAELMLGVSDLLDETDLSIVQLGSATSHETPGRTFFTRLQLNF